MAPKRRSAAIGEARKKSKKPDSEVTEDEQAAGDAGPSTSVPPQQDDAAPPDAVATDRRETMAELARRRAAHFAHFEADDEEGEGNIHTGGDEAAKLGPWSSARQLVEARADAALARKERLEGKRPEAGGEEVVWRASRPDWRTRPRPPPRKFLSLAQRCIITIADVVDCVESLYGLPQAYVTQLAEAVSNRRCLTPEAFRLFTEHNPSEVIINNCTQVNEVDMTAGLAACCTFRLEALDLRFCGRGFGDAAAAQFADSGPHLALKRLRLAGAYRLTPASLLKVVAAAPALTHLILPHCVRIQSETVQQFPELLPDLVELDLTACGGLDGPGLTAGLLGLTNLQRLTLSEVPAVDNALLTAVAASGNLRALHVQRCPGCTDAAIAAAAAASPRLTHLSLDELPVTEAALERLVMHCPDLEALSIAGCRRIKSELALVALASAGKLRSLGTAEVSAVTGALLQALAASCSRSLVDLDISFCRGVSAASLGLLLDECRNLESVKVYGCTQMTPECVHGHLNTRVMICGEPTFTAEAPAGGAAVAKVAKKAWEGLGDDGGGEASSDEEAAAPVLGSDSDSVEFI